MIGLLTIPRSVAVPDRLVLDTRPEGGPTQHHAGVWRDRKANAAWTLYGVPCLSYDGTSDLWYLDSFIPVFTNGSTTTFCVWLNSNVAAAVRTILNNGSNAAASRGTIQMSASDQLTFRHTDASSVDTTLTLTDATIPESAWTMLRIEVYVQGQSAGDTVRLRGWVGGTSLGEASHTGGLLSTTLRQIQIIGAATFAGAACWNGRIGQVLVFDGALSTSEEAHLLRWPRSWMTNTFGGKLVDGFLLAEGTATPVSKNGLTTVLSGAGWNTLLANLGNQWTNASGAGDSLHGGMRRLSATAYALAGSTIAAPGTGDWTLGILVENLSSALAGGENIFGDTTYAYLRHWDATTVRGRTADGVVSSNADIVPASMTAKALLVLARRGTLLSMMYAGRAESLETTVDITGLNLAAALTVRIGDLNPVFDYDRAFVCIGFGATLQDVKRWFAQLDRNRGEW